MRKRSSSTAMIVTLLLVAATVPTAWSATEGQGTTALLAVVNASGGSFAPDAEGRGTLVLEGVDRATWFTDRPARRAGVFSIDALGATFFDDQEPPNAALQLFGEVDVDHDVVILTISAPDYDATSGTVTYDAVVIPVEAVQPDSGLIDQVQRADPSVPTAFGRAVLFIDSAANEFKAKCLSDGGRYTSNPNSVHGARISCRWGDEWPPYRSLNDIGPAYVGFCDAMGWSSGYGGDDSRLETWVVYCQDR